MNANRSLLHGVFGRFHRLIYFQALERDRISRIRGLHPGCHSGTFHLIDYNIMVNGNCPFAPCHDTGSFAGRQGSNMNS